MRRFTTTLFAVVVVAFIASMFPRPASAADAPTDRVLVLYFHRTERCPTCLKMGSYSEEAVKRGFAERIKKGTVAFHYVDFQDKKNAALAKGYGVSGPALIIARIGNGKVLACKNLKEIWAKVADRAAFLKYVQGHVAAYDAPRDRVVAMYFHRTERCPTCRKMGSFTEEAVMSRFPEQIKDGTVAFYYVDYQDKKNAALAKRYGISGPALIVAKIVANKGAEFMDLEEIWMKADDKQAFVEYVQDTITVYHIQILQKLAVERKSAKKPVR
ncbi:MAG: nitrophenyl compound nitroreductase subunit ArsF family protein [Planctomycetota bacterium]|jgi:thiol-disulfide isomerase/thioredoxin